MGVLDSIGEAGKEVSDGAKFVWKKMTDAGEYVYDNIEAGMEQNSKTKIEGAKGNPTGDVEKKLSMVPLPEKPLPPSITAKESRGR